VFLGCVRSDPVQFRLRWIAAEKAISFQSLGQVRPMNPKPGQRVGLIDMTLETALVGFPAVIQQDGNSRVAVLEEQGHVVGGVVTASAAGSQGHDLIVVGLLEPRQGIEVDLMAMIVAVDFGVNGLCHVALPPGPTMPCCNQVPSGSAVTSLELPHQAHVDQGLKECDEFVVVHSPFS